jgi:PKD repeat protein
MAIDGTGKLWITYRTLGRIDVMWSTSADHLNWDFTGFTLDPAVRDHDLSTIVAFGNKIGVVWSHQTLDPVKEFRFRYHVDGDPEDSWSPNEVLIQGYYNVDQYINLAATPSGEVLFVGQVSGHRNDAIDFYVRRTSGVWEGNFELTQEASRPRVIYDAENNEAYAIYEDRSSSPYVIKYKKVSLDNPEEIGAAPAIPLIVGSGSDVGDVTSTSQWVDADSGLLVLAKSGSYALHNIIEISSANTPTAVASADPTGGFAPLTVQFTGDGTDPNGFIESYEWDFGDGFGSTEQNPEHTYFDPGTYSATLTVTDDEGLTDSATVEITAVFDPALDLEAPYTFGHDPAPGAVDVAVSSKIRVHIADDGTGVDLASIVMRVDGIVVTPVITGSSPDYLVEYTPPAPFDYLDQVFVDLDAQDFAAPPRLLSESYSFTTREAPVEPRSTNETPTRIRGWTPTFACGTTNPRSGTTTCPTGNTSSRSLPALPSTREGTRWRSRAWSSSTTSPPTAGNSWRCWSIR